MNEGLSVQPKLYELGYLLAPLIASEAVGAQAAKMKEILGGEVKAEGVPAMQRLAYTISKKIGATRHDFDDAYFGWFKFEALPEQLTGIKKELEKNDLLVRYLLTLTELTDADLAAPVQGGDALPSEDAVEKKEKPSDDGDDAKDEQSSNDDGLDQEIDELLERGDL